jgi:hypothetical protein
MRRVLFLSAVLLAGATGAASAACTPETRVASGLQTLFQGNRVVTAKDNEHHGIGGVLTECAQGAASTVDPTHVAGTWRIDPDGGGGEVVTYDYGTGGKFTFSVHSNGGPNYSFCLFPGGGEAATGNLVAGSC